MSTTIETIPQMTVPEHGTPENSGLKRELGLFSATMLVAGVMIGSGIFIVSADVARQVASPGLLMLVWLFTAVVTLFGAMSYARLATAFPEVGGQYVFLKKAWGEIPAFMYGWALFFVIQTGTLAAVAVAFAKFLGVLFPAISSQAVLQIIPGFSITAIQGVAIAVLMALTAYNCFGIKEGALLQNVFTVLKVLAVAGLIGAGFLASGQGLPNPSQWSLIPQETLPLPLLAVFAIATVGPLFSADAWNNVTFISGEVKNPQVNVAKAMVYGTALVLTLYLLVNMAYLNVLPFDLIQHAPEDRVATAAINHIWGGAGAGIMAAIILVSTFGCLNGLTLAGARVFYAMAKDKLFFAPFGKVHPRFHTPTVSLVGQGICASVLTLTGSYGQLLDYTIFTTLLFYLITISGMFRLAKRHPEQLRMASWQARVIPVTYLILVSYICINLFLYKPGYTLPGLGIVSLGIPIYFIWKAAHKRRAANQA